LTPLHITEFLRLPRNDVVVELLVVDDDGMRTDRRRERMFENSDVDVGVFSDDDDEEPKKKGLAVVVVVVVVELLAFDFNSSSNND
jgi:hypothetical protein